MFDLRDGYSLILCEEKNVERVVNKGFRFDSYAMTGLRGFSHL